MSEEPAEIGAEQELRQFVVPPNLHGQRLDHALTQQVVEFSRSYLQQLIEAGLVTIGGLAATKASRRVQVGDLISVELRPTPQTQAFKPEAIDLDVVYEDEQVLVLNKPAGLVVHPAPGNWGGTLLNALLARDPRASLLPRAGIVHRLDKDTSGLMVVARNRQAMDKMVEAIAARDVRRQYLAVGHRRWVGADTREIDAPIGRDPRNRLRMAVVDLAHQAGKTAGTSIRLLQNGDAACLVECTLKTGRTHQIRVHMSSIGHPLVGDALYGGGPLAGLERQALHAVRLEFDHPVSGQRLTFVAGPPADLSSAMRRLGLSYNPATD